MSTQEICARRTKSLTHKVAAGVLGVAVAASALIGATADAAPGGFPKSFAPETAAGFTSTFTPPVGDLKPACPQGIMGTPGSDPATKVLNDALNTPASFEPGGTVHYTYDDNPRENGGTRNFTIQDCVVAYPADTFQPGDFDGDGVLTDPTVTSAILKSGTQLDGGALSGISDHTGAIHFSWTSPTDVAAGSWICNFARDIRNNHGGGGNRKVLPTCFQIPDEPPPPPPPLINDPAEIFLAYADSFHDPLAGQAAIPFTPSPWQGDPGVVFAGCSGDAECGKYDGGAIRIDNPATNTVTKTVTKVEVTIGACVFDPWSATLMPQSVAPGQKLILTQTGLLGPPMPGPCRDAIDPLVWPYTNFDTSERAGDSRDARFYNCDVASGATPVITVTYSDATVSVINDTQKILNTGGVDSQACLGINEAAPWTGPIPY